MRNTPRLGVDKKTDEAAAQPGHLVLQNTSTMRQEPHSAATALPTATSQILATSPFPHPPQLQELSQFSFHKQQLKLYQRFLIKGS